MPSVSLEEFLIWKKKQLSKGGDQQSFAVLLDCIGGLSASDLNLISINLEGKIHLKKKLVKIKNYLAKLFKTVNLFIKFIYFSTLFEVIRL